MAMPQSEPRRALTAVRGLAALWVAIYHFREALPGGTPAFIFSFISRGYLAVDLFFVLSGFVIATNYAAWFAGGSFSVAAYGRFLALRLSRIYPLHLFMLLLFLINPLAVYLFSSHGDFGDPQIAYYLLSIVLMQCWGIVGGLTWNVPAWSISTEWFAYLAFPLLAIWALRITTGVARTIAYTVALFALLALAAATIGQGGLGDTQQLFSLVRCVLEFAAGIGVWRLVEARPPAGGRAVGALIFAAACFAGFALLPVPDYAVMPIGFAAVVYGLSSEDGRLAGWLHASALQWLGLVSYSVYMSHYFIKIWTKFLLVVPGVPHALPFPAYIVAILVASGLLYQFVERPSQRWVRARLIPGRRQAEPVGALPRPARWPSPGS
ncbi:MAG: acyltransferase [Rhodospirillales bacterium]|nr:acyltransferase [Rhodospirillales bacterium]